MQRENAELCRRRDGAEAIIELQEKRRPAGAGAGATIDPAAARDQERGLTEALATSLAESGEISASCAAHDILRASLQRSLQRRSLLAFRPKARTSPPRTLPAGPQQIVLDLPRAPRFADIAPAEIFASLLD